MEHERKPKQKRKAKPKNGYVVVDEPEPLDPAYAPLDHEQTESRKSNPKSGGSSFAQGCAFGSIIVVAALFILCMMILRGLSPILQSFAELLSMLS